MNDWFDVDYKRDENVTEVIIAFPAINKILGGVVRRTRTIWNALIYLS